MISFRFLVIVILAAYNAMASVSLTPDWEKISGRKIPDVVFTYSAGREIRISDIKNKIIILQPMFTRCQSTCVFVSSRLETAIKSLPLYARKNLFVLSFSFDPDESPETLSKFEKLFQTDGSYWKVVRGKPATIQQMLTALDFRTLQLSAANYEHPNMVFVVGNDRVLRDYIYGSDLTTERLLRSLRFNQSSFSPLSKSHIYIFAVIGLLISAFIVVQQLTKKS